MSVYHALYLDNLTEYHLREKLACLYDVLPTQILELYLQGPSSIHILVTDHVSALHFMLSVLWLPLFVCHWDRHVMCDTVLWQKGQR